MKSCVTSTKDVKEGSYRKKSKCCKTLKNRDSFFIRYSQLKFLICLKNASNTLDIASFLTECFSDDDNRVVHSV